VIERRVQELVDIQLISRLKARYARLVDQKGWAEVEGLLAGEFSFEGNFSSRGAGEFVARLRRHLGDASTSHQLHVPEIEIGSADEATATWPFSDVIDQRRAGVGLLRRGSGHYHESYTRTESGWRISKMRITRVRVDCTVQLPGGETTTHTCLSQDDLVAWLAQHQATPEAR
jgi:hypothetical protein